MTRIVLINTRVWCLLDLLVQNCKTSTLAVVCADIYFCASCMIIFSTPSEFLNLVMLVICCSLDSAEVIEITSFAKSLNVHFNQGMLQPLFIFYLKKKYVAGKTLSIIEQWPAIVYWNNIVVASMEATLSNIPRSWGIISMHAWKSGTHSECISYF